MTFAIFSPESRSWLCHLLAGCPLVLLTLRKSAILCIKLEQSWCLSQKDIVSIKLDNTRKDLAAQKTPPWPRAGVPSWPSVLPGPSLPTLMCPAAASNMCHSMTSPVLSLFLDFAYVMWASSKFLSHFCLSKPCTPSRLHLVIISSSEPPSSALSDGTHFSPFLCSRNTCLIPLWSHSLHSILNSQYLVIKLPLPLDCAFTNGEGPCLHQILPPKILQDRTLPMGRAHIVFVEHGVHVCCFLTELFRVY